MSNVLRHLGENLIVILGMPRSGTTWLGKIFDSHPDVLYRHEPDSIHDLHSISDYAGMGGASDSIASMQSYAASLNRLNDVRVCAKLPFFRKSYLSDVQLMTQLVNASSAKFLKKMLSHNLPVLGASWGAEKPHVRWVWKSIESLSMMGAIKKSLPKCITVHILRHPCAYIASVMRGRQHSRFKTKVPLNRNYGISKVMTNSSIAKKLGLNATKLRNMSVEQRLAWRWVVTNEKAIVEENGKQGAFAIKYEDLCAAPLSVAKNLFKNTGIAWHRQTEAFLIKSTSCNSNEYYSVYKKPLEAAKRWQTELSREQIDRIMSVVEGTLPWDRFYLRQNGTCCSELNGDSTDNS